jgi:integrase
MAKELLKDTDLRNAKPEEAAYRLPDGGGLYLLVQPSGAKWWRMDYTIHGKRKTLSLGTYPATGLKAARDKAQEARRQVEAGEDPSDARKAEKANRLQELENERRVAQGIALVGSFEAIAKEWFEKQAPTWAKNHSDKIIRRLERDVFPWIGAKPITDIRAADILAVLRRVEERGALETAHRAGQNIGQIFRFAVATGRAERDPTVDLRGALAPAKPTHHAAITDPQGVGALLRAIDGHEGSLIVRSALRLAPMVFVRPGELRTARWADIDLDAGEWRYTVTKTKTQHLVPLARQALDILRELHPVTGHGTLVFPANRGQGRPMSENTINAALRSLGYDGETMTGHGFRAIARTLLDEVLGFEPHIIEHQLAHAVKDPLGRAYNRTSHLPQRKKMMQAWADYLAKLKAGADVIPLHGARGG